MSVVWLIVFKSLGRCFLVIIIFFSCFFFNIFFLIRLCWVLAAACGIFYLSHVGSSCTWAPSIWEHEDFATGPPGKSLFFSVLIYLSFLFILNIAKDFLKLYVTLMKRNLKKKFKEGDSQYILLVTKPEPFCKKQGYMPHSFLVSWNFKIHMYTVKQKSTQVFLSIYPWIWLHLHNSNFSSGFLFY